MSQATNPTEMLRRLSNIWKASSTWCLSSEPYLTEFHHKTCYLEPEPGGEAKRHACPENHTYKFSIQVSFKLFHAGFTHIFVRKQSGHNTRQSDRILYKSNRSAGSLQRGQVVHVTVGKRARISTKISPWNP
jgi:hypothetical protein